MKKYVWTPYSLSLWYCSVSRWACVFGVWCVDVQTICVFSCFRNVFNENLFYYIVRVAYNWLKLVHWLRSRCCSGQRYQAHRIFVRCTDCLNVIFTQFVYAPFFRCWICFHLKMCWAPFFYASSMVSFLENQCIVCFIIRQRIFFHDVEKEIYCRLNVSQFVFCIDCWVLWMFSVLFAWEWYVCISNGENFPWKIAFCL